MSKITSFDAVTILFRFAATSDKMKYKEAVQCMKKIEKDLEMLDLIKMYVIAKEVMTSEQVKKVEDFFIMECEL